MEDLVYMCASSRGRDPRLLQPGNGDSEREKEKGIYVPNRRVVPKGVKQTWRYRWRDRLGVLVGPLLMDGDKVGSRVTPCTKVGSARGRARATARSRRRTSP